MGCDQGMIFWAFSYPVKIQEELEVAVNTLGERNLQPLFKAPRFLFLAFILGFVSMCESEEASEIQKEDMHYSTSREEN